MPYKVMIKKFAQVLFSFLLVFSGPIHSSAKVPSSQNRKSKEIILPLPSRTKASKKEETVEQDFKPSLSETISAAGRREKKVKRQLAKAMSSSLRGKNKKKRKTQGLENKTARFKDFEIDVSERIEENLKPQNRVR